MMSDLAGFKLVPANRDQVIESRKRHWVDWARGLSEEQYLAREVQFEKLEHAADGKLTIWVLVPRDDTQTLDFRCACETFRRRALVLNPSASHPEEITAYAIASVFCPPKYRRQGYASYMMCLLHHVLAPALLPTMPPEWGPSPIPHPGAEDTRFSVLYSDVGEFYQHCGPSPRSLGWKIQTPISTVWAIDPESITLFDNSEDEVELLTEDQCQVLWEADARYIEDALSRLPNSPRTRFTFMPNHGIAAFTVHRAKVFLANSNVFPKYWGISMPQKEGTPLTYATWTLDTDPLQLVVTRLRATPETFLQLVGGLLTAALGLNAITVEVWNLDAGLVDAAASLGGKTGLREEHLPAVAWYGPENTDEVEWVFNEKFPWC